MSVQHATPSKASHRAVTAPMRSPFVAFGSTFVLALGVLFASIMWGR